jgi:hypothetical protein
MITQHRMKSSCVPPCFRCSGYEGPVNIEEEAVSKSDQSQPVTQPAVVLYHATEICTPSREVFASEGGVLNLLKADGTPLLALAIMSRGLQHMKFSAD